MKKIISIDRIEGEFIVAETENCKTINLQKEDFADDAVVTACYYLGEDKKWHKDEQETQNRKKRNFDLFNSLLKKD